MASDEGKEITIDTISAYDVALYFVSFRQEAKRYV